jgi:hypothetical protein
VINPPEVEVDVIESYDHTNNFFNLMENLIKLQRFVRRVLKRKKLEKNLLVHSKSEMESRPDCIVIAESSSSEFEKILDKIDDISEVVQVKSVNFYIYSK